MPIEVAVPVRRITQQEFHSIDYRVMGLIFGVHNQMGNLCEEHIYRDEIAERCLAAGFRTAYTEVGIRVSYGDFRKRYSIDLLVNNSAVYEIKAAETLAPAHRKQALNYLMLVSLAHGKLANMKPNSVQHKFVSTRLTPERRYRCYIDDSRWTDCDEDAKRLRELMRCLISEWGAFLEVELFYDAVKFFWGGEDNVIRTIELVSGDRVVGRQRAHLINPLTAIKITAIVEDARVYEKHLRKFLRHTKLARVHWINFSHHQIAFTTIHTENNFAGK